MEDVDIEGFGPEPVNGLMPFAIEFGKQRLLLFVDGLAKEGADQGEADPRNQREIVRTRADEAEHRSEEVGHVESRDERESVRRSFDRAEAFVRGDVEDVEDVVPEGLPIGDLDFVWAKEGVKDAEEEDRRTKAELDPLGSRNKLYHRDQKHPHAKHVEDAEEDADIKHGSNPVGDEINGIGEDGNEASEKKDLPRVAEIAARKGAGDA